MKLEYVADASVGGSSDDLVRLFVFTPIEAKAMIDAIRSVVVSKGRWIPLGEHDLIELSSLCMAHFVRLCITSKCQIHLKFTFITTGRKHVLSEGQVAVPFQ